MSVPAALLAALMSGLAATVLTPAADFACLALLAIAFGLLVAWRTTVGERDDARAERDRLRPYADAWFARRRPDLPSGPPGVLTTARGLGLGPFEADATRLTFGGSTPARGVTLQPRPDAFLIALGGDARAAADDLVGRIHAAGLGAFSAVEPAGMKAQMRAAVRSGARHAVILGDDELSRAVATVRDLDAGTQADVPLGDVVGVLAGARSTGRGTAKGRT